jgi:hypothetical protein
MNLLTRLLHTCRRSGGQKYPWIHEWKVARGIHRTIEKDWNIGSNPLQYIF